MVTEASIEKEEDSNPTSDKFDKNVVQINAEQSKKSPGIINEFEDLFDKTLGKCDTATV